MPRIRCTQRLLKLLGKDAVRAAREDDSEESELDWYANLFYVEGRKCLIFVNAGTLFPVVALDVLKDDFRDPAALLRDRYGKLLRHLEAPEDEIRRELSHLEDASIGKTRDRSLIGSVTEYIRLVAGLIESLDGLEGLRDEQISTSLAKTPMGGRGVDMRYPGETLQIRVPGMRAPRWDLDELVGGHRASHTLFSFSHRDGHHDWVLSYHEMLGFMFYMAAAPGFAHPSEWIRLILGGEEVTFRDKNEMDAILREVIDMYNRVAQDVVDGVGFNFEYAPFRHEPMDNFGTVAPLREWCTGFSLALDWIPQVWSDIPPSRRQDADSLLSILMFFASKDHARSYMDGLDRRDPDLREIAAEVMERLPRATQFLAELGLQYRQQGLPGVPRPSGDGAPGPVPKVGRNEPCPCGSGKKYKYCHGRAGRAD